MNKRAVLYSLLSTAALAGLLLAMGLHLQPALAAPLLLVPSRAERSQIEGPPVQEGAQLEIAKMAGGDGTVARGQTVYYTIVITNTGTVTATNVTVRDDYDQSALPTIQVLADTRPEVGGGQNDGDVITWQLGDLLPGESRRLSYEAKAAEAFETGKVEVTNTASAQADNMGEVAQATVVLTVQAPQLELTLKRERVDGTGEIVPGDTVRYTISYRNNGTGDATNVFLEAVFDETVAEEVHNITGGGQRDGAMVRWNLGTVEARAGDHVSYDVMLKPALSLGTVEVASQATIGADDVQSVSASDSFLLHTPLLSIARHREDLNGDPIRPGDTLLFTIRFRNLGPVAASDVLVRDDYAEGVVAEVSDISEGGTESEGGVEWQLLEALAPGDEKIVSYKVRLKTGIQESTEVANTAIVYVHGVDVTDYETTMTVEAAPAQAKAGSQIFREQPLTVALLVGSSMTASLLVLGGLACFIVGKGKWKEQYFRLLIEGVAVVVIINAVLVLAMGETIGADGVVSILSGIAGYVLGRSVTEVHGSGLGGD